MNNIMYFSSTSDLTSGATHCLLRMSLLVKKAGYNVVVILNEHGDLEEKLKEENITYYVIKQCNWNIWIKNCKDKKDLEYYLKFYPRQLVNKLAVKKVQFLIKKHQINLIHINTLTSFVGAEAALKENIPFVWHIREFMEEDLGIEFCNVRKSLKIINQATAVISISKSIYDKYSTLLSVTNHTVVLDGVDSSEYYIDKIPFQNEYVRILSSGRLVYGKGQKDLLLALSKIPLEKRESLVCDIIGNVEDENYYNELLTIKKEYQLDNVRFHGFQSNTYHFFDKADVVCVCSKKEAFGRITVESMMAGALVIGTNTGGTKELIVPEKTGYLYSPGDIEQLSKYFLIVIEDREKVRNIAKAAQKKALEEFSDEGNAKKIISLYCAINNEERVS